MANKAINIFTCSVDELKSLANISATKAKAVLKLREGGEITLADLSRTSNVPIKDWEAWISEGDLSITPIVPSALEERELAWERKVEGLQRALHEVQTEKERELADLRNEFASLRDMWASKEREYQQQLAAQRGRPVAGDHSELRPPVSQQEAQWQDYLNVMPSNGIYRPRGQQDVGSQGLRHDHGDGPRHETHGGASPSHRSEHRISATSVVTPKYVRSHQVSDSSDSELSNSDSEDSSETDSSPEMSSDDNRRRRTKSKWNPQTPKMATFDGNPSAWKPFLFNFKQIVKSAHLKERKKRQMLTACLRDKAATFAFSLPSGTLKNYKKLLKALKKRYGQSDPPTAVRRQLLVLKQREDESLDEYAERTLTLVSEGFPTGSANIVRGLAVDQFLRGCRDKQAALSAMDKEPKTVHKALKYVKNALHNQRAVMGKSVAFTTRQVDVNESKPEDITVRQLSYKQGGGGGISQSSKPPIRPRSPSPAPIAYATKEDFYSLRDSVRELKSALGSLVRARSRSPGVSGTKPTCFGCGSTAHLVADCPSKRKMTPPSSPSRNASCYRCGEVGHFARECPRNDRGRSLSPSSKHSLNE